MNREWVFKRMFKIEQDSLEILTFSRNAPNTTFPISQPKACSLYPPFVLKDTFLKLPYYKTLPATSIWSYNTHVYIGWDLQRPLTVT